MFAKKNQSHTNIQSVTNIKYLEDKLVNVARNSGYKYGEWLATLDDNKVVDMKVDMVDNFRLHLMNTDTDESYLINICLVKITGKYRYYYDKDKDKEGYECRTYVAISVSDLMKHFYYREKSRLEKMDKMYVSNILKFIKKGFGSDTDVHSKSDIYNSLGVLSRSCVDMWKMKRFNTKHDNIRSFYSKLIYVPYGCTFSESLLDDKNRVQLEQKLGEIFNFLVSMGDYNLVARLYEYYTNGKPLNDRQTQQKIVYFDEPVSLTKIPDILMKEYGYTEYTQLGSISQINRNFNNTERAEAEKCQKVVLEDVMQIDDKYMTYPLAAWNKIYVNSWTFGRDDIELSILIDTLLDTNKLGKKYDKIKKNAGRSSYRMQEDVRLYRAPRDGAGCDRWNSLTSMSSRGSIRNTQTSRYKSDLTLDYEDDYDMLVNEDVYYKDDFEEEIEELKEIERLKELRKKYGYSPNLDHGSRSDSRSSRSDSRSSHSSRSDSSSNSEIEYL
jgi:hypothetical protein